MLASIPTRLGMGGNVEFRYCDEAEDEVILPIARMASAYYMR